MSRQTELSSLNGFQKSWWLFTRSEQIRFRTITMKWKHKNKDASIFHEMLVESLVRLHLFEQRIINRTQFFFGDVTEYRYDEGERTGDITAEDMKEKKREFDTYYWQVVKHKTELLKLAMANNISINLTEDGSIHSLFSALSDTERTKLSTLKKERNNGRSVVTEPLYGQDEEETATI